MDRSEKEKMIAGELYRAFDKELVDDREHARQLIDEINSSAGLDLERLTPLYSELFASHGKALVIQPPFYCDYGYNIQLGDDVYFNFNCVILDVCKVSIGDRCLFGPAIQVYTALHPMDHVLRGQGLENGSPVTIGSDVWIGGGAIICPGVSIGDRTVIGAGSVVTRSIPSDVFAAGNPCRVIRKLNQED